MPAKRKRLTNIDPATVDDPFALPPDDDMTVTPARRAPAARADEREPGADEPEDHAAGDAPDQDLPGHDMPGDDGWPGPDAADVAARADRVPAPLCLQTARCRSAR